MSVDQLYERYLESGNVSTDTRQITPGSVFFALKGPQFDANEFAAEAINKGASYAVVDDSRYVANDRCILVDNGLTALQELARFHRSKLSIPVLALTGSNGKTTSKELVHAVLSKKFKVLATRGNLNNHIGVPLTVLSIRKETELAVVEMGANHLGEIAFLCDIANPTHGFITNIGKAHIGTFGGFENIVRAKTELYAHLQQRKGVVFINSTNPLLHDLGKNFDRPVYYPAKGDFYACEMNASDPFLQVKASNGEIVDTQLTGAYNFENVAAALCIGKFFGVDDRTANDAVRKYTPTNMRSQVLKRGTNTIILDAYNANPSSMAAAIENLFAMTAQNKVLILGDMFELEDEAEKEHRSIAQLISARGFNKVYLCGSLFRTAEAALPGAHYFNKKEDLMTELRSRPITSSTILVKASRGIGLETIVDLL